LVYQIETKCFARTAKLHTELKKTCSSSTRQLLLMTNR